MAYTPSDIAIDLRDPALGYDALGPGLYPDETALRLNTGELVAVSMRIDREKNTQGFTLRGWARAIQEDGQTLTDGQNAELEIEHVHSVEAGAFDGATPEDTALQLTLAMLGEANTLMLSAEASMNISIRQALKATQSAVGEVDMGSLLFGQSA